jgi:phospholipase/carboxylesterase
MNTNWIHHLDCGTGPWTLLHLHGTGGNEAQLRGLAREIAPDATLLGVRGRSLDEGFPRFFRRFTAVRYDQAQIREEVAALAQFVQDAAQEYSLDPAKVLTLGYSNGANMALAALALQPQAFQGGLFLRPVMPLDDPPGADLSHARALVLHGARDPYAAHAGAVTPYLTHSGAQVEQHTLNAGHELSQADVTLGAQWWARHTQ